jgi:hypothetical protein
MLDLPDYCVVFARLRKIRRILLSVWSLEHLGFAKNPGQVAQAGTVEPEA